MKICFIAKYPPMEGKTSSTVYWLTRALGERGHISHIVTNGWEAATVYRERDAISDPFSYQPKGVKLHALHPFGYEMLYKRKESGPLYTERMASRATDVIKKYNLDIIDSSCMFPYNMVGYIAKVFTSKKQILRFEYEDISCFHSTKEISTIFKEISNNADLIVTCYNQKPKGIQLNKSKIYFVPSIPIDLNIFNPRVKPLSLSKILGEDKDIPENIPLISFIGKIEPYKGIYYLVEALKKCREDFRFLIVGDGQDKSRLESYISQNKKMKERTYFANFIPPWKMPSLLNMVTYVANLECDFRRFNCKSRIIQEAMACATCSIVSRENYKGYKKSIKTESPYKNDLSHIEDGIHTIVVDPQNINEATHKIDALLKTPDLAPKIGINARKLLERETDFEGYVDFNLNLYRSLNE